MAIDEDDEYSYLKRLDVQPGVWGAIKHSVKSNVESLKDRLSWKWKEFASVEERFGELPSFYYFEVAPKNRTWKSKDFAKGLGKTTRFEADISGLVFGKENERRQQQARQGNGPQQGQQQQQQQQQGQFPNQQQQGQFPNQQQGQSPQQPAEQPQYAVDTINFPQTWTSEQIAKKVKSHFPKAKSFRFIESTTSKVHATMTVGYPYERIPPRSLNGDPSSGYFVGKEKDKFDMYRKTLILDIPESKAYWPDVLYIATLTMTPPFRDCWLLC